MKIACIILASGYSNRFKMSKSKLMHNVFNIPIIEFTLTNVNKYFNKNSLYITIPKNLKKKEINFLKNYSSNNLIYGGKTRFDSVKNAIFKIKGSYDYILIHDAARPTTPNKLFEELIHFTKNKKYDCILPSNQIEDTLRKNKITLDRSSYFLYQTPQIFKFDIYKKAINNAKNKPTDDFGVLEKKKNLKIKFIDGNKENIKITQDKDLILLRKLLVDKIKYGNGFDIHRLKKGKFLSLAGLKIKSELMSVGHSDGDVVIHALIDALLGASGKGDIGQYFPATDKYKNISSSLLLEDTLSNKFLKNIIIQNLDCTIICQKIRMDKYKKKIKNNIADLLRCSPNRINVKAKTTDNIGMIGKSKAIACWITVKFFKI